VPVLALVAVLFTLHGGTAIVPLLLLGYNFVTQLFPALVLSLPQRRVVTAAGAIAGIVTGEAVVIFLQVSGVKLATLFPSWPAAITDLNIGIVALIANVVVLLAVSAATRRRA
jgi:SSS family solute:Na+ symporter